MAKFTFFAIRVAGHKRLSDYSCLRTSIGLTGAEFSLEKVVLESFMGFSFSALFSCQLSLSEHFLAFELS